MGRYDGIMIVSDLDGTFLGAESRIVPRNVEAVRRFCADGGHFTFATGRYFEHLTHALPNVAQLVNMPAILLNGACLYDFAIDRVLQEEFMDDVLGRELLIYAREHHGRVGFRVATPWGFLTDGRTDIIKRFIGYSAERSYTVKVAPIEQWEKDDWYKIVFRGAGPDIDAIACDVGERFAGAFEYNKSSETFFEVQKKGCSKGKMLKELKRLTEQQCGTPMKVYAVGDYENDLALLQAADVAVCPSNAHPSVKAISHWCLCDNDQGVLADLIDRL